jgi:hypothetical protein
MVDTRYERTGRHGQAESLDNEYTPDIEPVEQITTRNRQQQPRH